MFNEYCFILIAFFIEMCLSISNQAALLCHLKWSSPTLYEY